jgi:hypothetical protein
LSFSFVSARAAPSFTNWGNQVTRAGSDSFVIVEVTVMNKTGAPLPHQFQPIFRLLDETGALYEPDLMHPISINMQKPGRPAHGQNMNPNRALRQEIVFDVPAGRKYVAQVIAPNRARVVFAGGIASSGPYFLYDISGQLQR